MNRIDAQSAIAPHVEMVAQYQAVQRTKARELLGDESFARLERDKVRNVGPTAETLYPWNVLDYLDEATKL